MPQLIQQLYLFTLLFLFGCAVVGSPSGGPADKRGPLLVSISPTRNLELAPEQKIVFEFDELIDPVSVPPSVQINSDLKYKLKIRGRNIIIQPDNSWPKNDLIRISLSRKLRDYQKNIMAQAINIIFSTGSEIPDGIINGQVVEYDPLYLVELGLYEWPLTDSSQYIQKVEADEFGAFQFTGVEASQYTIGGNQGSLWDMHEQINKKKYAILTSDYISISNGTNEKKPYPIAEKTGNTELSSS